MKKHDINHNSVIKETFGEKYNKLICQSILIILSVLQITLIFLRAFSILKCSWVIIFLPIIISVGAFFALAVAAIIIGLILNRDSDTFD